MITFPCLYQKSSTGAIKRWQIEVDDNEIVTTHGQLGGAQQIDRQTVVAGKNIGRSNETTPASQAVLDAQSKWDRKVKRGYVADIELAKAGGVDTDVIKGGIEPMLAHVHAKQGHKILYPAFAQPKLDGHRCIAVVNDDGTVELWSRSRKRITGVPHIAKALESLDLLPGVVLDGELYHHDYRDRFEELTSFIRQQTPKPGHEIVQLHVYDIAAWHNGLQYTFEQRLRRMDAMAVDNQASPVVFVETVTVSSEDELLEEFSKWMSAGYEGAMVRNADSTYANKRSYDLQKVKMMQDAEFEVIDVREGTGRMAGRGIFVCKTEDGTPFAAKMVGSLDGLNEYLDNKDAYIGRMLTVQYQDLTAANGVPRFPVGLRFREDV